MRLTCLSVAVTAPVLVGCGGGSGGRAALAPVAVQTTGTFRTSDVKILVGGTKLVTIGRGFVTLDHAVPVSVGLELNAAAVKDIPLPKEFEKPDIYGIALPPESVYTPFTFVVISYWAGHTPIEIGGLPHFHPFIGMGPPQTPDPPDFLKEKQSVSPSEIPQGYALATTQPGVAETEAIVPGIGIGYVLPGGIAPGWKTVHNYLFYNGHMSGIGLGATNAFLLRQQAGQESSSGEVMAQPQAYPRPGYYPHRYTVRYDPARQVHIFALEDFHQASNVLIQRAR